MRTLCDPIPSNSVLGADKSFPNKVNMTTEGFIKTAIILKC